MEKAYFTKHEMSWAVLYMNAGVEREGPEFEWEKNRLSFISTRETKTLFHEEISRGLCWGCAIAKKGF